RIGYAADTAAEFTSGLAVAAPRPVLTAAAKACQVRDAEAPPVVGRAGNFEPDPELRDAENIPLTEDVEAYLEREVLPFVPDAWPADPEGVIGYEVPFTKRFYAYAPPRPLEEIDADIKASQNLILTLMGRVTE